MISTRRHTIPPGPRINPLSLALFGLPRDLPGLYMDAARRYGDVVRFQAGPFFWYFASHPDHVKHVLQDNHQNYCKKTPSYDILKLLVGEGLLTADGERWQRSRHLAQPAFHRERVAALATLMTDATAEMLDRWRAYAESGQPLDVASEMVRLTLGIVGKALFSADIGGEADEVGHAMKTALEYLTFRTRHPFFLPAAIPTPRNLRFQKALRTFDRIVYGIIDERGRSGRKRDDLLSTLLSARDGETGEGLSAKEVRDEVITFLDAGHETTAVALSWTWYLLSRHPDVGRKLRAELADVLDGRAPTVEDLPGLRYTKMVIEESMRLYPPAWAVERAAIRDDEFGGYAIPANSVVDLSPFVTHRHPAFWENPEGFDPERFTPETSAGRPRFAYFPFGGGPRQCIGNEFAMLEAQLIVAMVAQRYRLELVPGYRVEPDPTITLRPRHGVVMTLRKGRQRGE